MMLIVLSDARNGQEQLQEIDTYQADYDGSPLIFSFTFPLACLPTCRDMASGLRARGV